METEKSIFNAGVIENDPSIERQRKVEIIRGSIILLAFRLATTILIFEFIYLVIHYILTIPFQLASPWDQQASLLLFIIQIIKIVLEISFILYLVLEWSTSFYYIDGHHLVKHHGIIKFDEDTYDFKTVRSISIHESIIGRILNYGNIMLKTSASGGYQVLVTLMGINNPRKWEGILSKHF